MMRRWRVSSMKCRRPVFFGSLVVSTGASSLFLPIRTSSKKQTRATFAANQGSAGKLGQPAQRCAMLPRFRRRGSTYRNRPRQAQIEGTGQRGVRGCRGPAAVALGCFSSGPNARAAFGYWNQNFRYLPYENRQRRTCFNATETEFPAPKPPPQAQIEGTWQPGKGRSVGAVGQLGLLWGASVPTRTRERRLVTKIKFSLSALKIS